MTAKQKTYVAPTLLNRTGQPLNGVISIQANPAGFQARIDTQNFPVGKEVFVEWTAGPNSNWSINVSVTGAVLDVIVDRAVYATQEGKTGRVTYTVDGIESHPASAEVVA